MRPKSWATSLSLTLAGECQMALTGSHPASAMGGKTDAVRAFADRVGAERGVRSTLLYLVGVEPHDHHDHVDDHKHGGHAHLSPVN